jgi:transcriptional regulator with XRE-family HTH domain
MLMTEVGTVLSMTERGDRIRARREALGWPKSALAERAHVDRGTLDRVEDGAEGVRSTTLRAIERALSDIEEETGANEPEPPQSGNVVRFVVRGVYGAEALVVEGPVENIAELEASVDRIMRRLRSPAENGA